jgi:uncharacterized protein (TIGR03067 family)
MRFISLFAMTLLLACTGPKHTAFTHTLNGTWIPVKEMIGGNDLPAASFATQKLVILDSTYTFNAESEDRGIVNLHRDKMDIYGKTGVNAGKHFTALCKLENGELSICYNLAGDSYPENFDTKSKPAFFLCVYKKE